MERDSGVEKQHPALPSVAMIGSVAPRFCRSVLILSGLSGLLAFSTPAVPWSVDAAQRDGAPTRPLSSQPVSKPGELKVLPGDASHNIYVTLLRLPFAAVLGAALALRPRRRLSLRRETAVVQAQIVLAIVGALIMLVVGSSLARAFGIVGAANLIRYRSKIDDPKDAVVMLCTLIVGLTSGAGLYMLAAFSTLFVGCALWSIESFEPRPVRMFDLSVKTEGDTDARRTRIEAIVARFGLESDLRTSSDDEVCYEIRVPLSMDTEAISKAIHEVDADDPVSVYWSEKTVQR